MAEWRKVSMSEAIRFIRDGHGQPVMHNDRAQGPEGVYDCAIETFDDGTAVACRSKWSGPYSELTPDVDAEPPDWWIYT